MNFSNPTWNDLLRSKLEEISGLFFEGTNSDPQNPIAVGLVFSGKPIKISSGNKGEGLTITTSPLRPVEMGAQGALGVRNLSGNPMFNTLIGGDLESVESVLGLSYQDDLGVVLKFAAGDLWICNIGDEIRIDRRIPTALVGDIELKKMSGTISPRP